MNALVDTNVILDVLLKREPHFAASAAVMASIEMGHFQGGLCAITVTTIHYLAESKGRFAIILDRAVSWARLVLLLLKLHSLCSSTVVMAQIKCHS